MITMYWRGEEELYRTLIRLERNVETTTDQFLEFASEWLANDIRSHWSAVSPSNWGSAPAKVTHNLDSSIQTEGQGRDLGGRFASGGDVRVRFVRVNTAEGDNPMGRGNYAQALEDPNYLNRPFMQPAIDRLKSAFPRMAKDRIRV